MATKMKTYRLDDEDLEKLKKITDDVNAIAPRKISETRIIRGLLHLGSKAEPEKIIECLRELL
jgi:hypothetical protein